MVKHINDVLIHLPNKSHFSFKSGKDFLYILFYLPLRFVLSSKHSFKAMAHYLDETLMDCGCNFFNKQKKKKNNQGLMKKNYIKRCMFS